jgi:hypothetical protein
VVAPAAAAEALLGLIVSRAAAQVPAVSLPARRYVAPGLAGLEAWDCEQVTVALVQFGPTLAAAQVEAAATTGNPAAASLPALTLRAEIVRAVPAIDDEGDLPTPEAMHAAGLVALADAALLHDVRTRCITTAALTGGADGDVRAGPVTPSGPAGGYAGVTLVVSATLW